MSLLIWLPLDGNLENYGLLPAKFSMVNSSGGLKMSTTGGKTAYGYERITANTADYITSDISFELTDNFSMCCWCKLTGYGTVDSANGIITHHGHLTGGGGITMRYIGANDYRMSFNAGVDSNNRVFHTYYSETNIYNSWHHLCLTYNRYEKKYRMYIDGKKQKIYTNSGLVGYSVTYGDTVAKRPFRLFDWSTDYSSSAAYRPKCQLNDVRLYDHCLCDEEIEDLAQGLIAHWPLRDKINNNLITHLTDVPSAGTTLINKYSINADFSRNNDTYAWFNVSPALVMGKTYTISFDVENFPIGASWGWQLWNKSEKAILIAKDGHYKYTFTPPSEFSSNQTLSLFLFDDSSTRIYPTDLVRFLNFKIEEGDTDTPWCPHLSDTSIVFTNPKYLIDCGGNNCNIYMANEENQNLLKSMGDSARNKTCLYFEDGQTQYLKNDSCYAPYEQVTISCWIKLTPGISGASNYHIPFAIGAQRFEISLEGTEGKFRGGFEINGVRRCITTSKPVNDGQWHMLTITYDGSCIRYYVDSEEVPNSIQNFAGALSGGKQLLTIGHYGTDPSYGNKQCYMSDVRLYATALSQKQINNLYQNINYFTSNDSFYVYEYIEDNSTLLQKDGIYRGNLSSGIPLYDMKIKISEDGTVWARIFWHDVTNNKNWFNQSEVKWCSEQNKFSRMEIVNNFKTFDGIYEFMLVYPSLSSSQYNRWQQKSSPEDGEVIGYVPIHIDWPKHSYGIRKHGTSSYWNCDSGSTWYAALGQYTQWSNGKYIPAADESSQTKTELWVRIDNLSVHSIVTRIHPSMIESDNFYEI